MFQELAEVVNNREVMPGVYRLTLHSKAIAGAAQPGQFVMISADDEQTRLLRRPISIHSVKSDELTFLFAVVGAGTQWLAKRRQGDRLDILGPAGNGFSLEPAGGNLLLAAGGMGIAPFIFLAEKALLRGCRVKLLAGARTAAMVLPGQMLPEGVEYMVATEDGSLGEKGLVTSLLERYAQWADRIMICGPLPMFKAIAKNSATLLAGKPCAVSLEVRMGCGMGICYSCTVKTTRGLKQVCQDGPVFDINEIDWDWLK